MLERFLLATVATGSLSLLVHGMPQITGTWGPPLDLNAELLPAANPETTQVSWLHAEPVALPSPPATRP